MGQEGFILKIKNKLLNSIIPLHIDVYNDTRGFFSEIYQKNKYHNHGIKDYFVQDNHSRSKKNILRGLHYQIKKPQSQLVTILNGKVFYVCVDLRINSPNFKKHCTIILEEKKINQLYVSKGFASGFFVLSSYADVHYKVSQEYDKDDEAGINWADEELSINWPNLNPILNERDKLYPKLSRVDKKNLPLVKNN